MSVKFDGYPHIIEAQQFSREWIEKVLFPEIEVAKNILSNKGCTLFSNKIMITLFYEPSTRTRFSFEFAMRYLGGKPISTENAEDFSSAVKGETLVDTIRVLNCYRPDVIVLRHKEDGSAKTASQVSKVPIINAGDGKGQHPTQALLDIYTIKEKLGRIDGISVAMVGDLANGRTVHSLSYLLGKFNNVEIFFISPECSQMKPEIKDYLKKHNTTFYENTDLRKVAHLVDVVYQTRVQKERGSAFDTNGKQGFFLVDRSVLDLMKKNAIVMHPLPRVDEITTEVDLDPRAVYLTNQVSNGLYTRIALLKIILDPPIWHG